jgi:hypothetical protein
MIQKLRRNILLIQMTKIPQQFFSDFTNKYNIIDLQTARERFNELAPPRQLSEAHSEATVSSASRRVRPHSAG